MTTEQALDKARALCEIPGWGRFPPSQQRIAAELLRAYAAGIKDADFPAAWRLPEINRIRAEADKLERFGE